MTDPKRPIRPCAPEFAGPVAPRPTVRPTFPAGGMFAGWGPRVR